MPLQRPKFTNPATGAVYVWEFGHSEEEESGQRRTVTSVANTANVGLVRQQGPLQPQVLRYTGVIFTYAQLGAMTLYAELCETQTIYFTHPDGTEVEVVITAFTAKRQRAIYNYKADRAAARYWTFRYTLEMDVINVLAPPAL